jgi:hypothetical protein
MSKIAIVIVVIYHCHKPTDVIQRICLLYVMIFLCILVIRIISINLAADCPI